MKRKIFNIENLKRGDKLVITSKENIINFAKECTHIIAYFGDFTKPEYKYSGYDERYIFYNNQPQKTVFELLVKSKNAVVVIDAITDYDIDKILIQKRV